MEAALFALVAIVALNRQDASLVEERLTLEPLSQQRIMIAQLQLAGLTFCGSMWY
jgi:hypothetical protein